MKKQITIEYKHLINNELSQDKISLIAEAKKARELAYAPFSGFSVGAAARLKDGKIISASNQESDVFPLGCCAERALLYGNGGGVITSIAIISSAEAQCYPCGACAQLLVEREQRQSHDIEVIMAGKNGATIVDSAKCLLPFSFKL